jgi:hypothetical protein
MGSAPRVLVAAGLAAVLILGGLRTPAYAEPEPPSATGAASAVILDSLVIRVYDSAGVTSVDRSRAIARADAILTRSDIDIEWLDCPARKFGRPSPGCDTPRARTELIVRLANAPADGNQGSRWQALGYSLIDTTTGTGTMATVFVDRVTRLARHARMDVATVLARALAHEIGHLILGTNEHSHAGIMRETWTAQQLTSTRAQDWHFLPAQSEQMRQALLLNSAGANAALENHQPQIPNPERSVPAVHRP